MACRGVLFALSAEDERGLLSCAADSECLAFVQEEIEERWDAEWLAETDKAWDAIHRCLSGGKLEVIPGDPGSMAILGGRQLHLGDDYIVSFKNPAEVHAIAAALAAVDDDALRLKYDALDPDDYDGEIGEEDLEYTLGWFQDLRSFYQKAAAGNRAVIFTVDQ
jgi:hypothetical protein